VVRRIRQGRVQGALLRVVQDEGNSPESLRVAVREGREWRRAFEVAFVHQGHGMRGWLRLRRFAIRQLVPGGRPEVDVEVRRWQGEPACDELRGVVETERMICGHHEGSWRCSRWRIGEGPARTELREGAFECERPPWDPPEPWAVRLRFTRAQMRAEVVRGTPRGHWSARWERAWTLDQLFPVPED